MRISDLMTPNPETLTPDDTVLDAARIMERANVGFLPIVESQDTRRIIGCLTDRDIVVRGVAQGHDANFAIGDIMSNQVVCCSPEDDLAKVEQLMKERQLRRIMVVDDHGSLMGVVATADLARAEEPARVGETVQSISEPE